MIKKIQKNAKVVVKAIIQNNDNKYLVLKKKDKPDWEFAGGKLEISENLTQALKREVKEETGLDVYVYKMVACVSDKIDNTSFVCLVFNCYLKDEPNNKIEVKLSDEHDEYKWAKDFKKYLPEKYHINLNTPIVRDVGFGGFSNERD